MLLSTTVLTLLAFTFSPPADGYELVADTTPMDKWEEAEAAILTHVRQLTTEEMGLAKSGESYFSPDMTRVIFQAYPKGQNEYQMFTIQLDKNFTTIPGTLKQVSPGGGACTCGWFRPDGKKIIFGSSYLHPDMKGPANYHRKGSSYVWSMPGGMDIIEADLDGKNPHPLTTTPGYDAECSFSPDGKMIVFTSDRTGNPEIYTMRENGSDLKQLTHNAGYNGGPFFSPDGKKIIFRADRKQDDHLQLFIMNADGSGERQITRHSDVVNWAPFFLPTGHSVVFATSIHGHYNYEVYLLNIETGKHQRVTFHSGFDGLPVISPDGKKMIWTSQRGANKSSQIFLADFKTPPGY